MHKKMVVFFVYVFSFTALMSSGFYHWDEYFQILEFTSYKWGITPSTDLPWEFEAKIRPWIQPFLLTPFKFLGPFDSVVFFRLTMGLSLLFAMFKWLQKESKDSVFLFGGLSLWFLPMLFNRYSSEAFSTLFLIIFCLHFLKRENRPNEYLIMGVSSALCFWSRFQMGIFLFFPLFHIIFLERKWKLSFYLSLSFLFVCGIMVGIDSWGYGEFVFSPYEYFYQNIILKKTSQFGENSFWDYLKWIVSRPLPFVSIPLIIGFYLTAKSKLKDPLIQGLLAFVIVHHLIAHKELRFLFPLIPFIPLFIWKTFEHFKISLKWQKIFIGLNLLCLPASFFHLHPLEGLSRILWEGDKVQLMGEENPSIIAGGLKARFWIPKNVTFSKEESSLKFYDKVKGLREALESGCYLKFSSRPFFKLQVKFKILKDKKSVWGLVKC